MTTEARPAEYVSLEYPVRVDVFEADRLAFSMELKQDDASSGALLLLQQGETFRFFPCFTESGQLFNLLKWLMRGIVSLVFHTSSSYADALATVIGLGNVVYATIAAADSQMREGDD